MKSVLPLPGNNASWLLFLPLFIFSPLKTLDAQAGMKQAGRWLEAAQDSSDAGKLDEAISLYEKAAAVFEPPARSRERAAAEQYIRSQLGIGNCLRKKGDYEGALAQHRKALEATSRLLGPGHELAAGCHKQMGMVYIDTRENDKARESYESALSIIGNGPGPESEKAAEIYVQLGIVGFRSGQYDEAIAQLEKAGALYKKLQGESARAFDDIYYYLGIAYNLKGELETSLSMFRKALELRTSLYGADHLQTSAAHNALGASYWESGRLERSLFHLHKSLDIRLAALGPGDHTLASVYNNLGALYDEIGKYDEAIGYYQKALALRLPILGENHPQIATYYQNLGVSYKEKGEYRKSLSYQLQAARIKESTLPAGHSDLAETYHEMATVYYLIGDWQQALDYYRKALEIWRAAVGDTHFEVAACYNNMGTIYASRKQWAQALEYQQIALDMRKRIYGPNHPLVANTLAAIGEIYMSREQWDQAMSFFNQGLECLDLMREDYSSAAIRQYYVEKNFSLFENALHTLHRQYAYSQDPALLEAAFRYFEKSKSLNLMQALNEVEARQFGGISGRALKKEARFLEEVNKLEEEVIAEVQKGKEKNDSLLAAANARLYEAREQHKIFLKELEQQHPAYYQLKYDARVLPLAEIRAKLLDEQTALLEYFEGERYLFAFLISPRQENFLAIRKDFPLKEWVGDLRSGMYAFISAENRTPEAYRRQAGQMAQAAYQLCRHVFEPVEAVAGLPEKLIIIPDGSLSYVPFELLLRENPKPGTALNALPYLLNSYQMSYAYSATWLEQLQAARGRPAGGALLAFAPSFDGAPATGERNVSDIRQGLGPLIYNEAEVEAIRQLLGGEAYTGASATKANFLAQAGNYRIIHLSTHGKANDLSGDFAFLAFTPQPGEEENGHLLYNRELYRLSLPAEMVVLSACETGLGELRRGEGVVSLARGFSYAGARSLVTSLWNVNDGRTKGLMESFYRHLKAGKAKDEALRRAKLEFLEQYGQEAHPYYWAGFIAIGDMAPIRLGGGQNRLWLLAAAAVVILGFFLLGRRAQGGKGL